MKLHDHFDGWHLTLESGFLQLIQIDYRLGLFLSDALDNAQLFVETTSYLKGPDVDATLNPAEPASLAPILPLFNTEVVSVVIRFTGELQVQFGSGYILEVDPSDSYEAWQLGCSIGVMFVSAPGGKVSFFQQENHLDRQI
ncbi:MAG TPA: DUF6188 family protein [Candidatus Kapabacteria bacterium]|nr:DUF6188 family protein [Candidatus Kapabacteria bacterium]